jgi:DNA-binding transcriptional LysR family regulator
MTDIDLGALEAFAAVAHHRSFRGAAAARGVSPSTLSETVRVLETRLGLRLLNRTTRSVALTEAGRRLLDRVAPSLGELRAAVDQAHADAGVPAGTLRINAPPPAIELVLAPLVAPFLQANPAVRMEVVADPSLVDIVAEGFDAGVRWGEHLAQDVIAVPLGEPQRYLLSGAPGLLERFGRPAHPRDLMAMPCIRHRYPSGVMPEWEFERDGEMLKLDPPAVLVTTSMALQRRAAVDGLGVSSAFAEYVADDVAAGRLVPILEDWFPSFPGPFLYYPGNRTVTPALRAFIDFVKARRSGSAPASAPASPAGARTR